MGKLADKIVHDGSTIAYEIMASAGYLCVPNSAFITAFKAGTKTLTKLASTDLLKLAKFAEGTFAPSGDATETTPLKHSDGTTYFTITTDGTLAYDGEIPNFSEDAMKYLFGSNYKSVAVDGDGGAAIDGGTSTGTAFADSIFVNSKLGVITGFAKVEGVPLFIETTQGDYDFMLLPNATITASQAGSLDSDGTATWALNITANTHNSKGTASALDGANIIYGKFTA